MNDRDSWEKIFSYLSVEDVNSFLSSSKLFKTLAGDAGVQYLIHRMAIEARRLNPTFDVLRVLNYTGPGVKEVAIGGSFALSTVLQKEWTDQDIDIFVQVDVTWEEARLTETIRPIVECMCDVLGYGYNWNFYPEKYIKPCYAPTTNPEFNPGKVYVDAGIRPGGGIITEFKTLAVEGLAPITILCSITPMKELVRGFDLECCSCYVTKTQVNIPRPEFTFLGYTLFEENRSRSSKPRADKYKKRGFKTYPLLNFHKRREALRDTFNFTRETHGVLYYIPELSQMNPNWCMFNSGWGPYKNHYTSHSIFKKLLSWQ